MSNIYVPPYGPTSARIMWVGEMPGKEEVEQGRPHVGPSSTADSRMMMEAGLPPSSIFYTNVFRFYAPKVDDWITWTEKKAREYGHVQVKNLWLHPAVAEHINDLYREIDAIRPTLIIAAGNVALWALTGEWGITDWRGSVMQEKQFGIKVIPTFNPAYLFQDWSMRPIMVWDYKRIVYESQNPSITKETRTLEIRPSYNRLQGWFSALGERLAKGQVKLVSDIETHSGQIDSIGFATSPTESICIPFFSAEEPYGHYTLEQEIAIIQQLRHLFQHPNLYLIGQNWHYDAAYIARQWGFFARPSYDTRIAWHTLFLGLPANLGFMSSILVPNHTYWKDEGKTWSAEKVEERWRYNCKDCCATFKIYERIEELSRVLKLDEQVAFENALFDCFFAMELRGVYQSPERRKEAAKLLAPQIKERLARLETMFGHYINPRSPKQMKALFYDDLRLPEVYDRKKKARVKKLDKDALEEHGRREPILQYPLALIGQVRSLQVYDSTFVRARIDKDNRLRCSYSIPGTETLRLSSSETPFGTGANLQNIAKGSQAAIAKFLSTAGPTRVDEIASALGYSVEKAEREVDELLDKAILSRVRADQNGFDVVKTNYTLPNIRTFFLPDPGYDWLDCDLDRADAQIVAWEADDAVLKQMFREGVDIHTENSKAVGCTRQQAKNGIHAIDYLVGARTLAKTLDITVAAAEAFINRWFSIHPAIPKWHTQVLARLAETKLENRYVQSIFGFKRYYFEPSNVSGPKAVAWLGQHTVAVITNKAALHIYNDLPLVNTLLQVHDSLDFQTKHEHTLTMLPEIHRRMKVIAPYPGDPLTIPVTCSLSSSSWGEVVPLKELAKQGETKWLESWQTG